MTQSEDELNTPRPFTHPVLGNMTDAEYLTKLELIRERRLQLARVYAETVRIQKESQEAKLSLQLEKIAARFEKDIAKVDKHLEAAMLSANKIIALQLQLGVDPVNIHRLLKALKGEDK